MLQKPGRRNFYGELPSELGLPMAELVICLGMDAIFGQTNAQPTPSARVTFFLRGDGLAAASLFAAHGHQKAFSLLQPSRGFRNIRTALLEASVFVGSEAPK